jgi:hypothetical protein
MTVTEVTKETFVNFVRNNPELVSTPISMDTLHQSVMVYSFPDDKHRPVAKATYSKVPGSKVAVTYQLITH